MGGFLALLTLAGGLALVGAGVGQAHASGLTREQLEAAGWTCFASPAVPNTVGCFEPGRGRPFPGNPDPRPTYDFVAFDMTSGEFLYTGHLIRGDLYAGQPCGSDPYVYRDRIGYYECVHA